MKKLLALAAMSALPLLAQQAQAICLPWSDEANQCDYSYVMPKFIIKNATLTETLKFAGCKSVQLTSDANIVLYDDGSMHAIRGDVGLSGEWVLINDQFFFNFDDQSRAALLGYKNPLNPSLNVAGLYGEEGLASCQAKNTATTRQQIIAPTVAVTKNSAKVNSKNKQTIYTLQMKGLHTSDVKKNKKTGEDFVGAFSVKSVIKGEIEPCEAPNYCSTF